MNAIAAKFSKAIADFGGSSPFKTCLSGFEHNAYFLHRTSNRLWFLAITRGPLFFFLLLAWMIQGPE